MCVKACKKLCSTDLQDRKSVVAGLNSDNIIIDTRISVKQLHVPQNCCQKCNENLKRKKKHNLNFCELSVVADGISALVWHWWFFL